MDFIPLLVTLLILVVVGWLLFMLIDKLGMGDPWGRIAQAIVILMGIVVLLSMVYGYGPTSFHIRR